MNIFLVCGYGMPKDIQEDQNYSTYLHLVFNRIYELASRQEVAIIPCGGPTNCDPPFQGTEAEAIASYLHHFMNRETVRQQTKDWTIFPEARSLSTLESLLFGKEIIHQRKLHGPVTIFCEKTRERRLRVFGDAVFQDTPTEIYAIDFDVSKNRYLDPEIIQRKEDLAIQEGLWTIQDPERIQKHHELFEAKFAFLRKRQSEGLTHVDAVQEWFKNEKRIMREIVPNHPFLEEISDE
jgi:hypothetical protein